MSRLGSRSLSAVPSSIAFACSRRSSRYCRGPRLQLVLSIAHQIPSPSASLFSARPSDPMPASPRAHRRHVGTVFHPPPPSPRLRMANFDLASPFSARRIADVLRERAHVVTGCCWVVLRGIAVLLGSGSLLSGCSLARRTPSLPIWRPAADPSETQRLPIFRNTLTSVSWRPAGAPRRTSRWRGSARLRPSPPATARALAARGGCNRRMVVLITAAVGDLWISFLC